MRFTSKILLLSIFSLVVSSISAESDSSSAKYEFNCGDFGSGMLAVDDNNQLSLDVQLQNLDQITSMAHSSGITLGYHLHTAWINDDEAGTMMSYSQTQCGADYTGGHYDPSFACGPASEANNDPPCADVDYKCSEDRNLCELGDLSGMFGPLVVDHTTHRASERIENHNVVDMVAVTRSGGGDGTTSAAAGSLYKQQFVENNPTRDPALWSSIVFHDNTQDGKRILCCKIVESSPEIAESSMNSGGASSSISKQSLVGLLLFLPLSRLL